MFIHGLTPTQGVNARNRPCTLHSDTSSIAYPDYAMTRLTRDDMSTRRASKEVKVTTLQRRQKRMVRGCEKFHPAVA